MRFPPFDFQRDREVHHGDRSVTTTVSIVVFYRRFTVAYNRPIKAVHIGGPT